MFLFLLQLQTPSSPIIVNIAPHPAKSMSFGQVLLSAAGFTVIVLVGAALLGLVLGGLFIGYHKLRPGNRFNGETANRDIPLGLQGAARQAPLSTAHPHTPERRVPDPASRS